MNIEEINTIAREGFTGHLGVTFTGFDGSSISGEITVGPEHLQPVGVVHGGVYLSLAETLAGAGSILLVHGEGKTAMGTNVSGSHLAPVRSGNINGIARLVHKGDFKHIWDVQITDSSGKLISLCRVTNSIRETENHTTEQ